jgi:hypothetical protein
VGEREAAQVSGDIDLGSSGRPRPVVDDSSAAIPIEDSWLEEASEVTVMPVAPADEKRPAAPADEKSLSDALRDLEADGGDEKPPG